MNEYNAFLEEWKAIKLTQQKILEVSKRNYSKAIKWGCVAVLFTVFVLGFSFGIFIWNLQARKTISLAVNTAEECRQASGYWQESNKGTSYLCIFDFPK